ncbi:MAG: nucleoside kinase [Lachnospiraceae bacterium]|nr:nucleoside kinase [Lachnospiraceae bacterium]
MNEMIKLRYRGNEYEYPAGTKLSVIAKDFQKDFKSAIVLAKVDNKLKELFHMVTTDCDIDFEDLTSTSGHKAYKRSASLLLIKSLYDVIGSGNVSKFIVDFSIGAAYYCRYEGKTALTDDLVAEIKTRMIQLVNEDAPIQKTSHSLDKVIKMFHERGMYDKERLLRYRRSDKINIYSLQGFQDYFYGYMLPSCGYIKYFDLYKYDDGLMLQLPERKAPTVVPPFSDSPKLFATMKTSSKWGEMMRIGTVGELNVAISEGRMNEVILVQEALMESRIAEIAKDIVNRGNVRFVMIAGPSSSGKTTFSHRLSIELQAHGLKPHPIEIDNYFKNREDTPRDENGDYDFECLEAIDVEGFNKDMTSLLKGETVELPKFNFKIGVREYKGDYMTLEESDILVCEGIHGLNDELSQSLPKESKYKIYISALTTLNVDEHNRVPTTDGRLIRRMVRDYYTRGSSISRTLSMWSSVRRGEEKYIFPFQEGADALFNSAHIYEIAALKPYVEPLLFGVREEDEGYQEAKRLLKFLQYFLSIDTSGIPQNSIIREFIGGSIFQ